MEGVGRPALVPWNLRAAASSRGSARETPAPAVVLVERQDRVSCLTFRNRSDETTFPGHILSSSIMWLSGCISKIDRGPRSAGEFGCLDAEVFRVWIEVRLSRRLPR